MGTFTVSSRGTIFCSVGASKYDSSGKFKYTMCVAAGRQGTSWILDNDKQECSQVFIGELPDDPDNVVVACQHSVYDLSLCLFNEADGVGDTGDTWTPNQKRWGIWHHLTTNPFIAGDIAIAPVGNKQYSLYAIGMNNDFSVTLYQLNWDGSSKPVEGFHWTKEEAMNAGGLNLYDSPDRRASAPWSCAISLNPFAVQLGSLVRIRENGGISKWDLRVFLNDPNLKTHKGKFYSDGTFVMCSNRGVDMRYWDNKKGEPEWVNDPTNEGEVVQKMPLHNGALLQSLQGTFRSLPGSASQG